MENSYFTYRRNYTYRGVRYDLSYYNDKQYQDYTDAGLTKMTDWASFIPDDKYTGETAPWFLSLRRGGVMSFNPVIDRTELVNNIKSTAENFAIVLHTAEEMAQWIRDNTSCEEVEPNKFLIREAYEDIDWTEIEAQYLVIS